MKVRTRLVASFAYVLLVVIVALSVPLAIVLRDRARSELVALTRSNAQTIAASLGRDRLEDDPGVRAALRRIVDRYAEDVGGRVVVVDDRGVAVADSDGEDLGEPFSTAGRPEVRRALTSEVSAEVRRSDEEGGDIAVAAAPILDEGELVGVVRISRDVGTVQENVGRVTAAIVAVALAGVVAGLVLAVALARSLARPLSRLADSAHRLGHGDLSARVGAISGGEELEDLAGSFDEMAERVEGTVRAQREFVANASHQLRTPLTGIKLRLEAAIAEAPSEEVREQLRAADAEVDRLASIIERLLTMAGRIEEGRAPEADLDDAVERAVDRWRDRASQGSSTLVRDDPAAGAVRALVDPQDLDQILDVLIDNAIQHAPGRVELVALVVGDRVELRVQDHGPGIDEADRERVLERFSRGRGATPGGSGLGLAIARELVERWGGTIAIDVGPSGGARVIARFRSPAA